MQDQQVSKIRLGVNIDHVATIRNARGDTHPSVIEAVKIAEKSGADGITAHLREDRRHICDQDIFDIKNTTSLPLNMEMAATSEMLQIAIEAKPNAVCIVPEKREELTTEGGLEVAGAMGKLTPIITDLKSAGIRVSLFVEANIEQIEAAKEIHADIIEIHTGTYCNLPISKNHSELEKINNAAEHAGKIGLECHAGHGLNYENVTPIAAIPQIVELNIGHFLIGESIFSGLEHSIRKMRKKMDEARS